MMMIRVAKTKALISFAVPAKLVGVFVFAYKNCWFSGVASQLILGKTITNSSFYPFFNLKILLFGVEISF